MDIWAPSSDLLNWALEQYKKQDITYSPSAEFVQNLNLKLIR